MRKTLILGIISLVIIHVTIGVFFLTNYLNWDNALNVNPPNEPTTKVTLYEYPPTDDPAGRRLVMGENDTIISGLPMFSTMITLTYQGTLTEGTPAYISAIGTLFPEGNKR